MMGKMGRRGSQGMGWISRGSVGGLGEAIYVVCSVPPSRLLVLANKPCGARETSFEGRIMLRISVRGKYSGAVQYREKVSRSQPRSFWRTRHEWMGRPI